MQRQCCAYLKQRELAVERLVRCRQRRRRDLHPAGNIKYFDGRGGRGSCLELCCVQHSVRAYLRPNQFHYACSNAGEHFQYKGEGLCCAVLLAVQCCAYFSNKPLAVERSQCCNDFGGALQSAGSIKSFCQRGGGYAVMCCSQCSECAYLSHKPLAVEHSQCCNDDGGRLRNASEP